LKIEDFRTPKLKILSSLKSKKNIREARNNNVKVITRLDSNFVVRMFGNEFRKEDILDLVNPIRREIDGENYIIYVFKRCIWQKTAGNLFLIKGERYDDFIPLFTTSLKSKPETIIRKYKEKSYIKQTNKELRSLLNIEGCYFCKKENNYGYLFMVSLVYNIVQYLRLFFNDMSFKDALEELSLYLLYKNPPRCVFKMENKLSQIEDLRFTNLRFVINRVFGNIEYEGVDKMNIGLIENIEKLGEALSL